MSSCISESWIPWRWNTAKNRARKTSSITSSPSSSSMPTSDLWDLIMDMDWDSIIQHAQEHPEDAAYSDGHYHESVLYLACQHNPPTAAIRAILQAYPAAALQVSRAHHDLPLHIAARYQLSAEILEELLKDYPVTAVEQTRFGRTPLMALWEFRHKSRQQRQEETDERIHDDNLQSSTNDDNREEIEEDDVWNKVMVILRAVARYREDPKYFDQIPSTRKQEFRCHAYEIIETGKGQKSCRNDNCNDSDEVPLLLHAAVSLGALSCPMEVLEYVLARFPEQVSKRDRWGQLPIHIAVRPAPWNGSTRRKYRPREQQFVAALLGAYPKAARIRLCDGTDDTDNPSDRRFPLMMALSNRYTWSGGVQDLFRAAPVVLQFRDPVTALYPFQLAAMLSGNTTNDLDTIYELLRVQPQVMALMNTTRARASSATKLDVKPQELEAVNGLASSTLQTISMAAEIPLLGTATAALIGILAGNLG